MNLYIYIYIWYVYHTHNSKTWRGRNVDIIHISYTLWFVNVLTALLAGDALLVAFECLACSWPQSNLTCYSNHTCKRTVSVLQHLEVCDFPSSINCILHLITGQGAQRLELTVTSFNAAPRSWDGHGKPPKVDNSQILLRIQLVLVMFVYRGFILFALLGKFTCLAH